MPRRLLAGQWLITGQGYLNRVKRATMNNDTIIQQALTALRSATTEKIRFRVPLNEAAVEPIMRQAYAGIVANRCGKYVEDGETKAHIKTIVRWLCDATLRPSLLLRGNVGNGKTTTAKSIAATIEALRTMANEKMRTDGWKLGAVEVAIYNSLLRLPVVKVVAATDIVRAATQEGALEPLKRSHFLIIDDLGTEVTNNFVASQLFEVINKRQLSGRSTLISTNLAMKQFRDRYSERIMSRIISDYAVFNIYGDNIRYQKRKKAIQANS